LILAAGLLTKAYFLVFVPLFLSLIAIHTFKKRLRASAVILSLLTIGLLAGWWYARNILLYRSLSAVPEAIAGVGLTEAVKASPSIPWSASLGYLARGALWTGNNQFNTMSRTTLNLALALLVLGAGCYAWKVYKSGSRAAERIILAAIGLFALAL